MNGRIVVQAVDQGQHLGGLAVPRQPLDGTLHLGAGEAPHDAVEVRVGGRVVADLEHGQPRPGTTGAAKGLELGGNLIADGTRD